MADKKQRYIPVGKKLIPVSEETYLYHTRWVANERYRAANQRRQRSCDEWHSVHAHYYHEYQRDLPFCCHWR